MTAARWRILAAATLVGIAAAAGACGDSDEDSTDDDGASGSGASGGAGGAGATTTGAGGEECEPVDACQECGAASCPDERANCCATPGCPTIIACAREHDCNGTDCYTPETCQAVIDENGGPLGDPVAAAAPLGECAAMHCPECPQPPGG